MAASNRLGHTAILVVGVLVAILVTTNLRSHVAELVRHLRSGNWEVMTDRSAVEQMVRAKYADSAAWTITFPAASGHAFPLDDKNRKDSVQQLGQQSQADGPNLRFNAASLQSTYGGFLATALFELAIRPESGVNDPLAQLADEMTRNMAGPRKPLDPALYAQAQAFLAKLPKTNLLKKALDNYNDFGPSRGLDFLAYEVATSPSYDNPGAWDIKALTLEQIGKCKAKVSSTANANQVDADIALLPRLLEIELDRLWLSDAFLDSLLAARNPLTSKYFQPNGDLRVIPKRLWILLPQDARIEPVKESDRTQIASWGNDNTCCRVVCKDATIDLAPTSFRENKDATYTVRRSDQSPLLFAIVSRRRAGR
jgi:hypothetical protein